MRHRTRWIAVTALLVVPLLLTACGGESEQATKEAVLVEEVPGTDLYRITLTPAAATRLDIQTDVVKKNGGAGTVIPYAAVIYSPNGDTWSYVSPKPLTFVRQSIVVDRIDGDHAILSTGPRPGTTVATVGVQELFGAESGVGGGH